MPSWLMPILAGVGGALNGVVGVLGGAAGPAGQGTQQPPPPPPEPKQPWWKENLVPLLLGGLVLLLVLAFVWRKR